MNNYSTEWYTAFAHSFLADIWTKLGAKADLEPKKLYFVFAISEPEMGG